MHKPRREFFHQLRRAAPAVHRNRGLRRVLYLYLTAHIGNTSVRRPTDFQPLIYVGQLTVFIYGADTARHRSLIREGVYQPIARHAQLQFPVFLVRCGQKAVQLLKRLGAIVVVGIDDRKRLPQHIGAAHHRMCGTPRLLPSIRNGIALRQIGHTLVGIFYLRLGVPPPDPLLKNLSVFRLNDADDPTEACFHRIVNGIINDQFPVRAYRFRLLQSAVAAAQTCRHNDQCRFLHIVSLLFL